MQFFFEMSNKLYVDIDHSDTFNIKKKKKNNVK